MRQKREALLMAVRWLILAVIAIFLMWRIVAVNLADYFAQDNSPEGAATALKWYSGHPQALFLQGIRDALQDPVHATEKLKMAVRENPADGRSYAALARLEEAQKDLPAAEQAMRIAARMSPRRTDVQSEAAAFWMRRGNIVQAMQHWNVVLTFDRSARAKLFPGLLQLAENPAALPAFTPLLQQPLVWWPEFLVYAAANAQQLATVRALFSLPAAASNAPTAAALRTYLARLQGQGEWTEALLVWLNSLGKDQINNVGNLFNGGFEYPISNVGFDWISDPVGQVLVETASTYGSTGDRALHVVFRGPRIAYRHLRQYTLLPPGSYNFRGRVRPESLETERGVQWGVYCLDKGTEIPLATSERFVGSDQWRYFAFQFNIPAAGCPAQVVRLELAGRVALEFEAKGGIWFDDLAVDRQGIDY
jgi:tetratricopeptide (TPR) repeat protein